MKTIFVATKDPDEMFVAFIFVIVLLSAITLVTATLPDVILEDDNIVFPIVAVVIAAFVESNDAEVKIFPTVKLETLTLVDTWDPTVAFVELILVDN